MNIKLLDIPAQTASKIRGIMEQPISELNKNFSFITPNKELRTLELALSTSLITTMSDEANVQKMGRKKIIRARVRGGKVTNGTTVCLPSIKKLLYLS